MYVPIRDEVLTSNHFIRYVLYRFSAKLSRKSRIRSFRKGVNFTLGFNRGVESWFESFPNINEFLPELEIADPYFWFAFQETYCGEWFPDIEGLIGGISWHFQQNSHALVNWGNTSERWVTCSSNNLYTNPSRLPSFWANITNDPSFCLKIIGLHDYVSLKIRLFGFRPTWEAY